MSHGSLTWFSHGGPRIFESAALLFLIPVLPMASAQSVDDIPSSTPSLMPTTSISSTSSVSRTDSSRSMTTSFTITTSNSTHLSVSSTTTQDVTPQLFPGASQPNSDQVRNAGVFNYYFLFLIMFGVLTAVFLWWLQRRRKKRKEQMRLSGQNALARDLDGWINTRRWFHGTWRHNQTAAFVRREEGLNEHGEAPPPYRPKSDVTVTQGQEGTHDPASGLTIPLRTLSRDDIEQNRPPEYRETVGRGEASCNRPDTADSADTRAARPDAADVQPSSTPSQEQSGR